VFDAHRDDPEFGYRLLADEVRQTGHTRCDGCRFMPPPGDGVVRQRGTNGKGPGPPADIGLTKSWSCRRLALSGLPFEILSHAKGACCPS
jgi:hypothetical protein